MGPERSVHLLLAKASELEDYVKPRLGGPGTTELDWLIADVALLYSVVAEHIERSTASQRLYEAHVENLIERVHAIEEAGDAW